MSIKETFDYFSFSFYNNLKKGGEKNMKKIAIIFLSFFFSFFSTGCVVQEKVKKFATDWKADGREYGKEKVYSPDDIVETAFFKLKINSITTESEIEGYVPEDAAHQFIVLNVTIEDTDKNFESIKMLCDDFELTWAELEGETTFPEYQFYEEQLPDSYDLTYGESKTGNLIFITPRNVTNYQLKYYELWDDNFVGNTYYVNFDIEQSTK